MFTRRGRNSERGPGHNESRSRIQPMSVARSPLAQETIEIQASNVTNQPNEANNRSRVNSCSSIQQQQPEVFNGLPNNIDQTISRSPAGEG